MSRYVISCLILMLTGCIDPRVSERESAATIEESLTVLGDVSIEGTTYLADEVHGVYAQFTGDVLSFGNVDALGNVNAVESVRAGGDVVSGGDVYRSAVNVLTVPGSAASSDPANTKALSPIGAHVGWEIGSAFGYEGTAITYPLPLTTGDRIRSWELTVDKRTSWWCTVVARLYRVSAVPDESPLGAGAASGTTMSVQTIGETGLTIPVEAEYHYFLFVTGCGYPGDIVYGVSVATDRPPPA